MSTLSEVKPVAVPLADVLADVYAHLLLKRQERLALQPDPMPEVPRPQEPAHESQPT
jgi:hypothetical protein